MGAIVYGPPFPDYDDAPPAVSLSLAHSVLSWADDAADLPTAPAPHVASTLPRDWSALRSDSPHPWRMIRRRNHRVQPLRRPFPCPLPKKGTPPAPAPPPGIHTLVVDPHQILDALAPRTMTFSFDAVPNFHQIIEDTIKLASILADTFATSPPFSPDSELCLSDNLCGLM
ncbi:hypothetical protein B0H13DRAFT_2344425 [Mycena leptocephala]|nr:hypothetical protein B0H13DRAFT_2344425 [Mycena leptocephala]